MMHIFSDKKQILFLVIIIVIAAFLRLYNLGNVPFVADEFLDVNATYGYAQTGQWQAWDWNKDNVSIRDNKASDERAWIYRIQVAALYDYFAPTETTARLVSALWGILTTVLLYGIVYRATRNAWLALIVAALWAVSVPVIEMNRKIRMYSMFAPIFLLFSYSLYAFLELSKKQVHGWLSQFFNVRWIWLIPVVFLGALAYHLHPLTGNIIFVLFVYLCVRYLAELKSLGWYNRYGVYADVMIVGAILVAVFYQAQWQWFMATLVFVEDHYSYIGHILGSYEHMILGAALLTYGSYIAHKKYGTFGLWTSVNFWVILLSAVFLWNRNVGSQYIFFAQGFAMILTGIGLYEIGQCLQKNLKLARLWIVPLVFVLLVPAWSYFAQENNTYHKTSRSETPNYRKVFDYVKRNNIDGDVMITRNFRNYYYNGQKMNVFDFGSERSVAAIQKEGKVKKITRAQVEDIFAQYQHGWVVYSDNDEQFITKEARAFFKEYMTEVIDSPLIRGNVTVYRWSR